MGPRGPLKDVQITLRNEPGQIFNGESADQERHNELRRGAYTVVYRPVHRGNHAIKILWAEKPVRGSPFHVVVQ